MAYTNNTSKVNFGFPSERQRKDLKRPEKKRKDPKRNL